MSHTELVADIMKELNAARSVLLCGEVGSGKSYTLGHVAQALPNAVYLEKLPLRKQFFLDMAARLHRDGALAGDLEQYNMFPEFDDVRKPLARMTLDALGAAMMPSCKNYVIVIDHLQRGTEKSVIEVVKPLLDAGVTLLIGAAVDADKHLKHVRNRCVCLDMPPMTREEAVAMLWSLLNKADYPQSSALESKVLNLYGGKPGVVADLAAQVQGTAGAMADIRNISHTDSQPFNLTWPVFFIVLGVAAVLRFTSRQLDDPTIYVIAGTAYVMMMVVPRLMSSSNKM